MNTGGCYCGKIRFEVSGDLRPVVYCHCSQCRKFSGHIVGASSHLNGETHITGEVKWFESSVGYARGFCPECGSQMFWRDTENDHLSIMAGAFDEGTKLESLDHIFVADKADYYVIADGLPQYPQGRKMPK